MVLKTLSFLSHTAKFTASGRQGFPKKQHKLEKKIAAEEPLYGALASMAMGEAATPTKWVITITISAISVIISTTNNVTTIRQSKAKKVPKEGLYSPSSSPSWRAIPIER